MFSPEKERLADKRYFAYLTERYRSIGGYTGVLFCFIGLIIIMPAGLALIIPAERWMAIGFLLPGFALIFLGAVLRLLLRPEKNNVLSIAEGAAIVVVAWSAAIIAGAVPFLWAGLNTTQALFEATSGWTTTGLSVVDVSTVSPLLLFFRSIMQLAGGAGLAILMLSSMSGPAGVALTTAEGRTDQLVPQVRQSARLVLTLYSVYILLGVAALKFAGMDWLDAINHTFCAVSTGGFSTRADSIGFWNSPGIEAVLIVLMLLGTTNFLTVYTLAHGRFKTVFRNGELRLMAIILPLSISVLFFGVTFYGYGKISEQIRAAIFQAVTALSTTGYATVSLNGWNSLGLMVIMILMLIGGGTGSTAGGIKQHRIFLLVKGLKKEFTEIFFPPTAISEEFFWLGSQRRVLVERDLRKAGLYIALYLFSWLAGGLALAAFGHPVADSLFEFASALGTVGLSVGVTSATAPAGQLWIEIVGMLLGRLEFFVIFWGLIKIGNDLSIFLPMER
jgi:trk system potassium uptake protein TrkH